MSDYATSVIRTAVPTAWGAAVAWVVGAGLLPADLAETAEGFAVVLVAVSVALYYMAARAAEPHLPGWLAALLLGSGKAPQYLGRVPAGGAEVVPPA